MASLRETLDESISMIEQDLRDRANKKEKEIEKELLLKNKKFSKLQKEKLLLEKTIEETQAKIKSINLEMENLDPKIEMNRGQTFGEDNLDALGQTSSYNIRWASYTSNEKTSKIETIKELIKSNEFVNYKEWTKIKKQVRNQFNLAVTPKQKQGIIIGLQTGVEWKKLGINLPNLFDIQKVDIVKGKIILNNALPDKSK